MSRFRSINNDKEHHQVLLELGLLDDMDNYELYCIQSQREFDRDSAIDAETWLKYTQPAGRRPS